MKRMSVALGLLEPGAASVSTQPWRYDDGRRGDGYCAARDGQLDSFERPARRDGRVSKDERRWIEAMRAELATCHRGGRPDRYYGPRYRYY